ncbi:MAG: fibronectin type III domain-containing protein [Deferrisomatales bacterium]
MALRRRLLASLAGLYLVAAVSPASARDVTIGWDPNPSTENVVGYVVYFGPVSRYESGFTAYPKQVDVGNTTQAPLSLGDEAVSYVAVVAYNAAGQSDYSEELVVDPAGVEGGTGGGGGSGCFLGTFGKRGHRP